LEGGSVAVTSAFRAPHAAAIRLSEVDVVGCLSSIPEFKAAIAGDLEALA
jgi:hypothetical protein